MRLVMLGKEDYGVCELGRDGEIRRGVPVLAWALVALVG